MFFQSLLKKQDESVNKNDSYQQLQYIVITLLNRELPAHYTAQHILYTANLKLADLREVANYHRKRINLNTSTGTFHKIAYEKTIKCSDQLELLIDSYITFNIEKNREQINHRLSLIGEKVEMFYGELIEFQKQNVLSNLSEEFWNAYKEDIFPILAELR